MRCTRTKILVSHGLVKPPVISSYSTVSGNSGLVWGLIPRKVALLASEEHRWLTCMPVCR